MHLGSPGPRQHMRRSLVLAYRIARRNNIDGPLRQRASFLSQLARRHAISREPFFIPRQQNAVILQSSMYFRGLTLAVVSSIVASGAWLAYRDNPQETALRHQSLTTSSLITSPSYFVAPSQPNTFSASQTTDPAATPTAEQTRKALIVEKDQLLTADITGTEPLSKEISASGRLVLEMLTADQATQRLRQDEQSYLVGRGQGIVRFDVNQLASNNPIEDDLVQQIIKVPEDITPPPQGSNKTDWTFFGVFDGHSGWTTSAKLRQSLVQYVSKELNNTYKAALTESATKLPAPDAIDAAIKRGFVNLDNQIVHNSVKLASKAKSKDEALNILAPAYSGSCALLSFYDPTSQLLRVACAGDSRAVLGQRGTSGKWTATALSVDQTGGTPSEIDRLRAEHPGEPNVCRNGRILGQLEPSRAFGDAIYKWSVETAVQVKKSFFGRSPSPYLKTPPYVTAEPIVTTTKVNPEKGDFLVLGCDGLWECLSNEEVVGLVGQWLDSQQKKQSAFAGLSEWFSYKGQSLPVETSSDNSDSGNGGQRPPIRQQQWDVNGKDDRFVFEDQNVATHIIRNALGGRDREMVSALLSLPSPYSRRYRDDLTVQVVFFGSGPAVGDVTPNLEASSSLNNGRAKL